MRQDSSRLSPEFWMLWWAAATSNIGDGIRLTALPLLIAAITRDPLVVSGVTAATFIPWVIFSLPGGALVDRWDRQKIMITGQVFRGLVVGALAVSIAMEFESVLLIYVTAFVIGLGEVFVDTSSQAAIPVLVAEADLESANSKLLAVEFVANDALGGPVGAWLFATMAALPFIVDSASFLLGAVLIAQIARPLQGPGDRNQLSIRDSIREGVAFVRDQKLLRGLAFAVAGANLAVGAGGSILVLLALEILDMTEFGFGLLVAAGATGGFLGALTARRIAAFMGRRRTMTTGAALLGVGQIILGTAVSSYMAGAGFLLGSIGVSWFSVVGRSVRQAVTPDRILGRVVTTFRLIGVGAVPIGALSGGALAAAAGVRVPYLVGALIIAGVAFATHVIATEERISESIAGRGVDPETRPEA